MTEINWQEPPSGGPRIRAKEIDGVVAALKARPGVWALVATDATTGTHSTWRKRGLEVRMNTSGKQGNRCDIYARWPETSE